MVRLLLVFVTPDVASAAVRVVELVSCTRLLVDEPSLVPLLPLTKYQPLNW